MRVVFGIFATAAIIALVFLGVSLKEAYDEREYWKTREATLEHELKELRKEVDDHKAFLERLRRDPNFQDAMARKELGFGKPSETNFRFPEETKKNHTGNQKP